MAWGRFRNCGSGPVVISVHRTSLGRWKRLAQHLGQDGNALGDKLTLCVAGGLNDDIPSDGEGCGW